MKKSLIFSSLILVSIFLSACGTKPVLKQMSKDAYGTLPDTNLSAPEMIAGGASFSCIKNNGSDLVKLSYSGGKIRLDISTMPNPQKPEEIRATSTELFDGKLMYAWGGEEGYQQSPESFLKKNVLQKDEGGAKNDVISVLANNFENINSSSKCQDEIFTAAFFQPVAGIEYKQEETQEKIQ